MRYAAPILFLALLGFATWAEASINRRLRQRNISPSVFDVRIDPIRARQATRSRIVGRAAEKKIMAAARRVGALRPRASVAPYKPYTGTETSSRTYGTYPVWDVAFNDLSADGVGPRITNIATVQQCIDICNNWKTAHPSSVECSAISYDAPAQYCWVKGTDYNSYQFFTKTGTRSYMVGGCAFWDSAAAPKRIPPEMASTCEQLNAA